MKNSSSFVRANFLPVMFLGFCLGAFGLNQVPVLFAQYTPPTTDRKSVTINSNGVVVADSRPWKPKNVSGSLSPTNMVFSLVYQNRPLNFFPEKSAQLKEDFTTGQATNVVSITGVTPSFTNSLMSLTHATNTMTMTSRQQFRAPFVGGYVTVKADSCTGGTNHIGVGIWKDANNRIMVYHDLVNSGLNLKVKIAGSEATGVNQPLVLTPPYKLGFVLNENVWSVLVDRGQGWEVRYSWNNIVNIDMTLSSALTGWRYSVESHASLGTRDIDYWQAGYFGQAGIANQYLVTYEDGTPIREGRKVFLASTSTGLDAPSGGRGFKSVHTGVYAFDPTTFDLEERGKIFFERSSHVYSDIAGAMLFDRDAGLWRTFFQNTGQWGDVTAQVMHATSSEDLLNGVHVLSNATALNLPGAGGEWDAAVIKVAGTWRIAYNNASFYFLQATSSDLVTWSQVGSAVTTGALGEGARYIKIADSVYATWGTVTGGMRFFDLSMVDKGSLTPSGWQTVVGPGSHPGFIPVMVDGVKTKWVINTFTQDSLQFPTGGGAHYGAMQVWECTNSLSGLEFPVPTR